MTIFIANRVFVKVTGGCKYSLDDGKLLICSISYIAHS